MIKPNNAIALILLLLLLFMTLLVYILLRLLRVTRPSGSEKSYLGTDDTYESGTSPHSPSSIDAAEPQGGGHGVVPPPANNGGRFNRPINMNGAGRGGAVNVPPLNINAQQDG
ncbi:hypothetical protein M406DRAFT_358291 [Cryphonectria parasitica EP155]|uniref:Uncharacterized protein n=1 Tax=Cryphonectria parasitica (strain ATCC 38755 / EP155) TaxID=660469 RepID=A0A9P4XT07_CRYP1|nr:uncharacterized protein M406DRAFT_358291 [Cryphonectria parasitica EP155]KAF3760672.1 hypothetical protein M406DRAFT_358291 [Cryphonectria parasitica EP155]